MMSKGLMQVISRSRLNIILIFFCPFPRQKNVGCPFLKKYRDIEIIERKENRDILRTTRNDWMAYQSEAALENKLIKQLVSKGYQWVPEV